MKRPRPALLVLIYLALVGLYGVIINMSQAAAIATTPMPSAKLNDINTARTYLQENGMGAYITYVSGSSVIYKPNANATSAWTIANNVSTTVTPISAHPPDPAYTNCIDIVSTSFVFQVTFHSNVTWSGHVCGVFMTSNGTSDYSGGKINIVTPAGIPIAMWIADIDGTSNARQKIYFSTNAAAVVYRPDTNPSWDYSGSTLVNNGTGGSRNPMTGQCDNGAGQCNAVVLFLTNNFNSEVSMKSADGYVYINNNMTLPYHTLTFNPNGGTVDDSSTTYADTELVRETSSSNALRDYAEHANACNYPNPTRSGYTFDYWMDGGGAKITSCYYDITADHTLYAHWTHNVWTISGYTTVTSATAVPGQQVTFTHYITNSTPNGTDQNISSDTQAQVNGVSPSICGSTNVVTPKCGHDNGRFTSGQTVKTDTDTITIPLGTAVGTQYRERVGYAPYAYDAPAYDPANPSANYGSGEWKYVTIVASPYLSVVGGNTWAGGSTTSPYTGSGTITGSATSSVGFGSFGEYGIFATGPISYFGSAGRLGSGTTGMVDGTRLTFASTGSLGSFTNSHKITDLTSRCSGAMTSSVTIDAAYLATLNLQANTSNNHRVICGNVVTIATNITYATTGATTFGQLPSLTVIANTIQVNGRDATNTPITQIAGNFYAVNKFITCTEGPTSVAENATKSSAISTTGACSGQLTINGTVTVAGQTANALVLNRSYGGDAPNKPAEIIKMRPESFLTPFEAGTNTSLLTTVSEKELPARY